MLLYLLNSSPFSIAFQWLFLVSLSLPIWPFHGHCGAHILKSSRKFPSLITLDLSGCGMSSSPPRPLDRPPSLGSRTPSPRLSSDWPGLAGFSSSLPGAQLSLFSPWTSPMTWWLPKPHPQSGSCPRAPHTHFQLSLKIPSWVPSLPFNFVCPIKLLRLMFARPHIFR